MLFMSRNVRKEHNVTFDESQKKQILELFKHKHKLYSLQ